MKNKLFLMIMVIMVCSLCACGQQKNGTMTNAGNSRKDKHGFKQRIFTIYIRAVI